MAKISRIFNLGKTQFEIDFVDIDPNKDKQLYIDPFFLSTKEDAFSIAASKTVRSFFQYTIDLIRIGKITEARANFVHLNEPNETCLGLSKGKPKGGGMADGNSSDIFRSILHSSAITSGLLDDIENTTLFIDGIGPDKVSDMTTNIIRWHLIKYTQEQCELHGIPMQDKVPSGYYWNSANKEWEIEHTKMLIIGTKKILLIPKGILSYSKEYTASVYHRHFALVFLQLDHKKRKTSLVQKRYDKHGNLKSEFVTKKDLIKNELPLDKEKLYNFTKKHPEIFQKFKDELAIRVKSLDNSKISDNSAFQTVTAYLISQLYHILPGANHAQAYHKLMIGILELIFYPLLTNPIKEKEINEGRKRVDIVFDNAAREGFFHDLHYTRKIPCQFVFVECKNYSNDIENPEVDQMIGRLSPNKGKFGIILCRDIKNYKLLVSRCRDAYANDQGLIIPLTDKDIISILNDKIALGENAHPENILLGNIAREIILG